MKGLTIGERIKLRREELNLSQDELAKRLGYKSRSSINKIEVGSRNLTQSRIKAIADALETTPSYIMGWEEFDQQFDVEKLEAETGMWDFIGEHYGEETAERLHQYLTFSERDQEKISKLLAGYAKLDDEDRTILFARAYQILEDMLAAEKYFIQKESRRA